MTFIYHDELYAPADQLGALKHQGAQLPSWDLTQDLEQILPSQRLHTHIAIV